MVTFVAGLTALAGLLTAYAWVRLVRAPRWSRRTSAVLTSVLVVLLLSIPLGLSAPRWLGREAGRPLTWVGTTWVGGLFLLFVVLLTLEVVRAALAVRRAAAGKPVDLERRRVLARALAGVAGAGTVGVAGVAVASALVPPRVDRVRVPLRRLPPAFEGFRIAQLSDLHVGPLLRREFVEDVVARTNALEPDVIAITGDLADGTADELREVAAPLAGLRAREGVFFTTGNHEYYVGVEPWLALLTGMGVRVLRNERVSFERGGAALVLAGVDDAGAARFGNGHGPDPARALAGRDPARPVVMMAHQPRQVRPARDLDVDLVLSGHTHGGQIAPFGLFVRLVQPAVKGLHRFGGTWLYVNRGTGFWGPPMRLANPPEITLVELVREPDAAT